MCPACYASMALVVSGATSAGGLTAFVATKVCKKRRSKKQTIARTTSEQTERSINDDNRNDSTP